MTQLLKETMRYFVIITVIVLIASSVYITAFYGLDAYVTVKLLWQILVVSLLASLSHILFHTKRDRLLSKKEYYFRWFLCYLYVNVAVLGLGFLFQWFDISSLSMVAGMLLAVLLGFLAVAAVIFLMDTKTSEEINRKLQERNAENKEQED